MFILFFSFIHSPRLASSAPARRLWSYLVRQEHVQDIFIRCVFGKKRSVSTVLDGPSYDNTKGEERPDSSNLPEPVRIIHKEQDSISAFCLNQVSLYHTCCNVNLTVFFSLHPKISHGFLTLATPREVQEMDISLLLELPSWLEDECEFDLINLNKYSDWTHNMSSGNDSHFREPDTLPASSYLVIQTAVDKSLVSQSVPAGVQNYAAPSSPQPGLAGQSGRGASVVSTRLFQLVTKIHWSCQCFDQSWLYCGLSIFCK